MPNTYTQIHIHVIFTVQNRHCIIRKEWKDELFRYITGIIQNNNHKVLAINGMPDHVHVLIGMRPSQSLSELMKDIKGDSSKWINQKGYVRSRFSWQEGFGAFSYGKSQVNKVIDYIKNQETHHRRYSFIEEYLAFLKNFEVDYDLKYIFTPVESDKP